MNGEFVEIQTGEGLVPTHVFHPTTGEGPWPSVVYLMDGMGIRPTLLASAERLAQYGYYVLVPDLFYRSGDYDPLDHSTLQDDPDQQARVMEMVALVTNEGVLRDIHTAMRDDRERAKDRNGAAGSDSPTGDRG